MFDIKRTDDELLLSLKRIIEVNPGISQNSFDRLKLEGKPGRATLLRHFRCSWQDIVKKALETNIPTVANNATVPVCANNAPTEEPEENGSASRQYLIKQNNQLRHELDKQRHLTQVFIENCLAEIEKLNIKPAQIPAKENSPDNLEFHALRSDAHVGEYTDPITVQGLAEYNSDIYAERVKRWTEKIILFREQDKRSLSLNKAVIVFLGDQVTGEAIFPGQPFYLDLNLTDQLFYSVEIESNALLKLAQVFPEICIFAVCGNHGRIGKKGDHSNFNIDYLFYRTLQTTLARQENIKIFISESPSMLVRHGEYNFLYTHGDNAKSWAGIPFYGIDRMFRRMPDLYSMKINFECVGHFHQPLNIADRILMNGSLPGGSDLSINRMGLSNIPSQKIFYFSSHFGINRESNLYLDTPIKLQEDTQGIYTSYV